MPGCSDLKRLTSHASRGPTFPVPQNPQMSEMWIHARSHVIQAIGLAGTILNGHGKERNERTLYDIRPVAKSGRTLIGGQKSEG